MDGEVVLSELQERLLDMGKQVAMWAVIGSLGWLVRSAFILERMSGEVSETGARVEQIERSVRSLENRITIIETLLRAKSSEDP